LREGRSPQEERSSDRPASQLDDRMSVRGCPRCGRPRAPGGVLLAPGTFLVPASAVCGGALVAAFRDRAPPRRSIVAPHGLRARRSHLHPGYQRALRFPGGERMWADRPTSTSPGTFPTSVDSRRAGPGRCFRGERDRCPPRRRGPYPRARRR
jgi:hypothetical protein